MVEAPEIALSTWSIHRAIGVSWPESPDNPGRARREETWAPGALAMTDVPARVKAAGIDRLEIVSFHIDRHDRGFLAELKAAIDDAGIVFQTLLIDDGDITDPVDADRDIVWIDAWVELAAELGAEKARVILGKQPPSPEVLDRAVASLSELAERAEERGVRLLTENWLATAAGPAEVNAVLDRLDGRVGLLADLGNWKGPGKYDDLAAILPRAENCHSKASFDRNLAMDADDYGRCLDIAESAAYGGPHTLIYEGENPDEWGGIAIERDFLLGRQTHRDDDGGSARQ